jgi:hypothetical protein
MKNHITYLNNGPMVKDLFLKHGRETNERFKPSHLHFKFVGLVDFSSLLELNGLSRLVLSP